MVVKEHKKCTSIVHQVGQYKKMFINGEIQGPIKGVAWYSKGIVNNGSHLINLLEYWLGHIKDVSDVKFNKTGMIMISS